MKVIITIGFFVHIIFLFSIFDIYFKSPVITGIPPRPELTDAPANRLVLFVADGLRADSFFRLNHNKSSETPYLRYYYLLCANILSNIFVYVLFV